MFLLDNALELRDKSGQNTWNSGFHERSMRNLFGNIPHKPVIELDLIRV